MLYWGFAGEDAKDVMFIGNRELTTGGNTPKPILTGFEFLAKLASNRVKVIGNTPGDRLGIIPTSDTEKTAILLYNFTETDDDLDRFDKILLTVQGLKANQTYKIEEFLMDSKVNNSYAKWKAIGSPAKPSELPVDWKSKFAKLESSVHSSKTSANGVLSLDNSLQRHSMKLLLITSK
jgi:beta-xylosidase